MTDDLIARAEAALDQWGDRAPGQITLPMTELLAALKAARAEVTDRDEALETVRAALKAARAIDEMRYDESD